MTGGYGCIGSWVARQLVRSGHEVWIYDLKEDTRRLDLILSRETNGGPFRCRRCVGPGSSAIGRQASRGNGDSSFGGFADADVPGPSAPGGQG